MTASHPTPQQLLALPLGKNDADAATVRDYLIALLRALWRDEEGFSGKRPFGNSGWSYEVYGPMVKAGYVAGTLDEDGFIEDVDDRAADKLIDAAILALAQPDSTGSAS